MRNSPTSCCVPCAPASAAALLRAQSPGGNKWPPPYNAALAADWNTIMEKAFASKGDLADKKISFTRLAECAYAYTAEGDPNSGVVIGDDGVMVIDTTATPAMAQDLIRRIREVTDKPIKYVVLS